MHLWLKQKAVYSLCSYLFYSDRRITPQLIQHQHSNTVRWSSCLQKWINWPRVHYYYKWPCKICNKLISMCVPYKHDSNLICFLGVVPVTTQYLNLYWETSKHNRCKHKSSGSPRKMLRNEKDVSVSLHCLLLDFPVFPGFVEESILKHTYTTQPSE